MPRYTEADFEIFLAQKQTWNRGWKRIVPKGKDEPDPGPESALQKKCEDWLTARGWGYFHDRSRKKNKSGLPDLIIWAPECKTLQVELKAKGGRLLEEQVRFRQNIGRNGHVVHEVRSFKRFLEIVNTCVPSERPGNKEL